MPSAAVIAAGVARSRWSPIGPPRPSRRCGASCATRSDAEGAAPIGAGRPTIRFAPDLALWRYAARSALASLVVVGVVLGSSLLMRDAVVTTVESLRGASRCRVEEPVAAREYAGARVSGSRWRPNGDVYLADAQDDVVRRVGTQAGLVPVGCGRTCRAARSGTTPIAKVETPGGVAVAPNGDLFIADTESHRVFRVDRVRGTTVVVAGNGKAGFGGRRRPGDQGDAQRALGVAVDRAGNLYIADTANHRIRKVTKRTGAITTWRAPGLGDTGLPAVGDGDLATKALLSWPMDLAVASTGDLYVADTGHNRVRRIDGSHGPDFDRRGRRVGERWGRRRSCREGGAVGARPASRWSSAASRSRCTSPILRSGASAS